MLPIKRFIGSTLGQKFLMSLTGISLVLYLILHLLGNLSLLSSDPRHFNRYANSLQELGTFLYFLEIILLAIIVIHIGVAIRLKALALRARPIDYSRNQSKGGPSKWGISSLRLIYTGAVVGVFLVVHVVQFRFGGGTEQGYIASIDGMEVRDLYRLVIETLRQPVSAFFYAASMIFLGVHLRHGVWSAFQSMGWTSLRTTQPLYRIGTLLAWVLAVGFLVLPLWIFFSGRGGATP